MRTTPHVMAQVDGISMDAACSYGCGCDEVEEFFLLARTALPDAIADVKELQEENADLQAQLTRQMEISQQIIDKDIAVIADLKRRIEAAPINSEIDKLTMGFAAIIDRQRMSKIASETMACPFCKDDTYGGYDLIGLKSHLANGDCPVWNQTEDVWRLV